VASSRFLLSTCASTIRVAAWRLHFVQGIRSERISVVGIVVEVC